MDNRESVEAANPVSIEPPTDSEYNASAESNASSRRGSVEYPEFRIELNTEDGGDIGSNTEVRSRLCVTLRVSFCVYQPFARLLGLKHPPFSVDFSKLVTKYYMVQQRQFSDINRSKSSVCLWFCFVLLLTLFLLTQWCSTWSSSWSFEVMRMNCVDNYQTCPSTFEWLLVNSFSVSKHNIIKIKTNDNRVAEWISLDYSN